VRVVLDTNIFVSALLTTGSVGDTLVRRWLEGGYALFTSETQLQELRRVSERKRQAGLIRRSDAGTLINLLRREATVVAPKEVPTLSPDPDDNLILAIAVACRANYLASLDLGDVVKLEKVGTTRILHARDLLELLDS